MTYVCDASALIAYLRREPGGVTVLAILDNPEHRCFVHAVNLCEVYYDACRSHGIDLAQPIVEQLLEGGLTLLSDMDPDFWRAAGRIKTTHKRVSLADCFAIAIAQRLGANTLTTDHHEFDAVAQAKICAVTFLR